MTRALAPTALLVIGLAFVASASVSCRRASTVAERMPSASASLEWALDDARREVSIAREEIAGASFAPTVEEVFLDECDRLDAEIFSSRVELDRVVRSDDTESFARLARSFDPLHARIRHLRDDVLIARAANDE